MTVSIRKPKFDTIKTRSWTARTRPKRGGQWGVTRAHVRRGDHPNYISHSISTNPIKWGRREKSEKIFQPDEYRSAENYLRAHARNIWLEDANARQARRALPILKISHQEILQTMETDFLNGLLSEYTGEEKEQVRLGLSSWVDERLQGSELQLTEEAKVALCNVIVLIMRKVSQELHDSES